MEWILEYNVDRIKVEEDNNRPWRGILKSRNESKNALSVEKKEEFIEYVAKALYLYWHASFPF